MDVRSDEAPKTQEKKEINVDEFTTIESKDDVARK